MTAMFSLPPTFTPCHVDDGISGVEQAVGASCRGRTHGCTFSTQGLARHVLFVDLGGIAHQAEHVVVGAADQRDRQALMPRSYR